MADLGSEIGTFLANLAVVFGGVFGGAIGFVILVLVGGVLLLPYVLMTRRSRSSESRDNVPNQY